MKDPVATICEDNLDYKPICDMEFLSEQAAYEFYNEYGRRAGFSIRRDSHNKNKNTGQIISRVFVCCKEGFRPKDKRDYLTKSSRAETRTGCNAKMSIKLNKSNGKYWVSHFMENHNHPLVRQECTHMLPSHRRISASQAIEVDLTEESGIPLRQVGGRESLGYIKQDQKNYLRTKRQRKLAYGEAGSLLKYFQNEALENPSFFYAVQLDCDEQITNIFWADAKMIVDYGQFGDFVCFDTTYKTNEANRPFGVFVGFNHHREIAIFGAASLYDETANSFIWLFETFLEAMSKKTPKTLFTDQDAAMAKACAHVMPDTYHRLCTWHIMQNAMKHVNSLFRCTGGVRSVLTQFMDYYEEEDEFLVAWDSMLDEYNVRGHPWLESIFDLRKKWAMAYCKWSWSTGVKTTQISESFNATLKDYLNVDHDVVQFFMHFERVLNDKRYKELEAEYALCQKLPKVTIPVSMVVKAGNIYTKAIFEDFQAQYIKSLELDMISCDEDGDDLVYTIVLHGNSKERRVRKQKDGDVSCSCRLFEMKGFLCSHALKILTNYMNVKEIPDQYILKRWTRKARSESVKDMHGRDIQTDVKLQQTSRYRSLCSMFTKISSRAAESEETYKISISHLNQLSKTIEDMLSSKMDGQVHDKDGQGSPSTIVTNGGNEACFLDSAKVIQAKGLKKREASRGRKRIKSCLEKNIAKNKKSSSSRSSQVHLQMQHLRDNNICHSATHLAQDHGAPNTISWMPYREPQNSFQPLLNPASFPLQFQDLQVSNDILRSQAMNLMIDKPHTASNVDQTGDGIWTHGSIYQ